MTSFTFYPAIDLRRGRVVRLQQGDPQRETFYSPDVAAVSQRWRQEGATWVHVVNLDGAFGQGGSENLKALQSVLATEVQVQYGGGLRLLADMESVLEMGVDRLVLGTVAIERPGVVRQATTRFGTERVAVTIDVHYDRVRTRGWTKDAGVDPLTLAVKLRQLGVTMAIVTDIRRDGMEDGINLALARRLAVEADLRVIAAGGVTSLEDICEARRAGLQGVIAGRALYEGTFTLAEALQC